MKKIPTTRKIGVLRGLMPRVAQAEFAASFRRFEPVFITGGASREIRDFCQKSKLKAKVLKLEKLYKVDPLETFLGRRTHQSFVGLDGLAGAVGDLDLLETYELFHFFSGQAADAAKLLQIPLVVEVWTSFAHPAYFVPPYSFTVRKVINTAALFVARSYKASLALLRLGIPKEKVKVVYHGVNINKFKPKYKSKKNTKKITILYVGEMEEYKGVGELLSVWPEIYKKYPHTNLWFVGKGRLTNVAKGLSGVKVFGYVRYSKLPDIYKKADIFVSPSKNRYIGPFLWWEEFFSYTLMEAQASGLPVIGGDSGGIAEEIGSKNLLVDQGDRGGLKKAMIKLINDKSLRKGLSSENRKRAEKLFDLEKNTRLLEAELDKIILSGR